jgi:hypothetical protein
MENKINDSDLIKHVGSFSNQSYQTDSFKQIALYTDENKPILKPQIDIKQNIYPYCIVWTPLPVLSWFFPFIGHTGICTYNILT